VSCNKAYRRLVVLKRCVDTTLVPEEATKALGFGRLLKTGDSVLNLLAYKHKQKHLPHRDIADQHVPIVLCMVLNRAQPISLSSLLSLLNAKRYQIILSISSPNPALDSLWWRAPGVADVPRPDENAPWLVACFGQVWLQAF
jgi:hypothetical protein